MGGEKIVLTQSASSFRPPMNWVTARVSATHWQRGRTQGSNQIVGKSPEENVSSRSRAEIHAAFLKVTCIGQTRLSEGGRKCQLVSSGVFISPHTVAIYYLLHYRRGNEGDFNNFTALKKNVHDNKWKFHESQHKNLLFTVITGSLSYSCRVGLTYDAHIPRDETATLQSQSSLQCRIMISKKTLLSSLYI